MEKKYTVTITPLPESMVEIKGEITWDAFSTFEAKAFNRLAALLEVDGFRKGNVPEAIARKHLNDELILTDMAELAIQEFYPIIVTEENIEVIGRPELAITKIARGSALGFTIRSAVLPEIKLPEYKKLAKGVPQAEPVVVAEEDIDKVIQDLRQLRAYGHVHQEGDTHEHAHDEPLPEVNDEFAKSFGDFASVADLREKVKENITREKEQESKDKRRIAIMEAIISKIDFNVPAILLKSEQDKMLSQIEADITRAGLSMDDYLAHAKKTREGIMEEFKPEAEKRARFQLVVNAIARDAKISATDEEVNVESERLIGMYPGADIHRTKAYADMILTNEKTLSMLESQ
jgi:FKBP-type peptidyl-prolyl cis-trans isomerase (trigger factor)